jgi:hypothetical protein
MIFCGQCGLQLPPGATRCPRCGTPVEGDTAVEEFYGDDPTVASSPYLPHTPPQPDIYGQAETLAPNNPQKRVLGADKQSTLEPSAPTSRIDASSYNRRNAGPARPPSSPNADTFRTDHVSGGNYPTQGASYPGYRPQSGSNYPSQEAPYPVVPLGTRGYSSSSSPYPYEQPPASSQRARGRVAALVIILLGLLLILGAMVIFALKQNALIGGTGGANGTVTTPTLQEQAKALIEQYYNDVNNKDYQNAYNLWKDNPQSIATFSQGYAHTQHDDITIDNVTTLSGGTVKVFVTLSATEDASSGTGSQTRVYKGYYIIGPQNGVLKILSGQFSQVSS